MRGLPIAIAVIALAITISFLVWAMTQEDEDTPVQNGQQEENIDNEQDEGPFGDPQTWETYESEQLLNNYTFTVQHPQEVSADMEAQQTISFDYIGPDSIPDSEITDGFTVTVRMVEPVSGATIEEHTQSVYEEIAELGGGQVDAGDVQERTFNGNPARQWEQASVLGNTVTHLVVELDEQTVAEVSYSIAGDTQGDYEDAIEEMLTTLRFGQEGE